MEILEAQTLDLFSFLFLLLNSKLSSFYYAFYFKKFSKLNVLASRLQVIIIQKIRFRNKALYKTYFILYMFTIHIAYRLIGYYVPVWFVKPKLVG